MLKLFRVYSISTLVGITGYSHDTLRRIKRGKIPPSTPFRRKVLAALVAQANALNEHDIFGDDSEHDHAAPEDAARSRSEP